jgi:hypothetical protein
MSELVYPHSIDAGTPITANEVQSNFDEVADIVNGQLQGGSGSDGNLAADGVTARELANLILTSGLPPLGSREGLASQPASNVTGLYVSAGAGLVLNYSGGTVWVRDDSGVLAAGALVPVVITGSTVTVTANSSGNPRLDQVILTMTGYGTGTVSVLPGTPNAATTINNRTGAAALPSDAILIADILMTNGFAGPFVDHTSIRNRLAWAVPMKFSLSAGTEVTNIVVDSQTEEIVDIQHQGEASSYTANIGFQLEGNTGANYGTGADELQLSDTSVTARFLRGGWGQTAGYINISPNGPATGALRVNGRGQLSLKVSSTTGGVTYTGDAVASSAVGSGNHVLGNYHIGSIFRAGLVIPVSWMRLFPSAGTLTGQFVVDRVPMV